MKSTAVGREPVTKSSPGLPVEVRPSMARPVMRRLLPLMTLMLFVLVSTEFALDWRKHRVERTRDMREWTAALSQKYHETLKLKTEKITAATDLIATDPRVKATLRERDVKRLLADWGEPFFRLAHTQQITHLNFYDLQRTVLARLHNLDKRGDRGERHTLREAERTGQLTVGLELGVLGALTLRVVAPVVSEGRRLGYVELGMEIQDVLRDFTLTGIPIPRAVMVRKSLLERDKWEPYMHSLDRTPDWDRMAQNVAVHASMGQVPEAFLSLADESAHAGHAQTVQVQGITSGGRLWDAAVMPLHDATGTEVGDLLFLHDASAEQDDYYRALRVSGGAAVLLLTVLLSFVYVLLRRTDAGIRRQEEDLLVTNLRLEAASRIKSEFLANMSHEIRTPMNGVIGMTTLLRNTELNAEQREFTDTISSSAEALLSLINDILDFSKIEAGKLDLELIDFDLRTLLEEVADLLAFRATEKQLELICHAAPEVPSLLQGDPGRLRQILLNLVGNAIKFTHQGEVAITVTRDDGAEDDPVCLRFTVRDTGIGIAAEQRDQLFAAFTQADASTTRKYGGTGLGLSISKRLVELMGGEIGVNSEVGQGSSFWFVIELSRQETAPAKALADLCGRRVLVVDDNATNRRLLEVQLAHWQCQPVLAESGLAALEVLASEAAAGRRLDVAVLDMNMPGMDGLALGRAIHGEPRWSALPLIMLTSVAQRGDAIQATEYGFSAYLTKPVKNAQLHHCLAHVLGQAGAAETTRTLPLITRHTLTEQSRRGRILVADDNPTNQKVVLYILANLGHQANSVANGREAVQLLEQVPYDLVLMDCQMPEMDGYEATRAIRAANSRVLNRAIPIIALTADAMHGTREKALDAGMNDYLAKPIDAAVLAESLRHWLTRPEQGAVPAAADATVAATSVPPASTFEAAALIDPLGGNRELARLVAASAMNDFPRYLAQLEQACQALDWQSAERPAHTMKGLAAQVGGLELARLMRAADERLKRGEPLDKDTLAQLMTEYAALAAALQQWVDTDSLPMSTEHHE